MYLVLKSRLESVANWQYIGSEVLKSARKQRGLSYEAVGRLANVSSKTYERYERDGRVPEHMVDKFAGILGLEIERAVPTPLTVTVGDDEQLPADDVATLLRELRSLRGVVESRLRAVEADLAQLRGQEGTGGSR